MGKFQLEVGEVELFRETVQTHSGKTRVPGSFVLTDRRVVVTADPASPLGVLGMMFGVVGALLGKLFEGPGTSHQIDRSDFAAVEQEGSHMLSFHSKGEGYGHISFVVYSRTPFAIWQQRMHQWAAGTVGAAPIPTARVVK